MRREELSFSLHSSSSLAKRELGVAAEGERERRAKEGLGVNWSSL